MSKISFKLPRGQWVKQILFSEKSYQLLTNWLICSGGFPKNSLLSFKATFCSSSAIQSHGLPSIKSGPGPQCLKWCCNGCFMAVAGTDSPGWGEGYWQDKTLHDDIRLRRCFLHYWLFVRGIQRTYVDSLHVFLLGKGPVLWSFGGFFVVRLLNKQLNCQWYEMSWRSHDILFMNVFFMCRIGVCGWGLRHLEKKLHMWLFSLAEAIWDNTL